MHLHVEETAVHLDRQTAVGESVGRVSAQLGAGFPESCPGQARDCPWASAGAAEHSAERQAWRAPRQQDAPPQVAFPALARDAVAARVAALVEMALRLASPQAQPR